MENILEDVFFEGREILKMGPPQTRVGSMVLMGLNTSSQRNLWISIL